MSELIDIAWNYDLPGCEMDKFNLEPKIISGSEAIVRQSLLFSLAKSDNVFHLIGADENDIPALLNALKIEMEDKHPLIQPDNLNIIFNVSTGLLTISCAVDDPQSGGESLKIYLEQVLQK